MVIGKSVIDCFFASKVKMWVVLEASHGSIVSVGFYKQQPYDSSITLPVTYELQRYFTGENVDFSSYDVDLSGYTQFQQEVLTAARSVRWGTCVTYSQLASMVSRPRAARAVGNALGANSVPVIIPCHRIVAKHNPGGYSMGIRLKLRLLSLESINI